MFAPHHFYTGIFIALVVLWIVSDDYRSREPRVAMLGVLTAIYGFVLTWPVYPAVGAALTLVGLAIATGGAVWVLRARFAVPADGISGRLYPPWAGWGALLGVVIALDDAVEHAFGWWTPLDWVWKHGLGRIVVLIGRALTGG